MAFVEQDKICQRCGDSFRIYSPQQLQKKYCNNGICSDRIGGLHTKENYKKRPHKAYFDRVTNIFLESINSSKKPTILAIFLLNYQAKQK